MIYFLVREISAHTILGLLQKRARHLTHLLQPLYYERLHRQEFLQPGTVVFTDLDRLDPDGVAAAQSVFEYLAGFPESFRLLNEPALFKSRYTLLDECYSQSINSFKFDSVSDGAVNLAFPVYLRKKYGHGKILTDLLHDSSELKKALRELSIMGISQQEICAIEFCDTSDPRGIYTKYSAFIFDDKIYPRHVNFSDHWLVKSASSKQVFRPSPRDRALKTDYFDQNPHREWLTRVFELAGISYGRADYSLLNGRPQLWEVNSNPTFGRLRKKPQTRAIASEGEEFKLAFYRPFLKQLESYATSPGQGGNVSLAPVQDKIAAIQANLNNSDVRTPWQSTANRIKNSRFKIVRQAWRMVVSNV